MLRAPMLTAQASAVQIGLAARTGSSSWENSDVAWQSPTSDAVAVFAGHGAQGMGSSLAHHVARGLGTPPAASARERAAWMIRRAHEAAIASMDPASGTFGTMATVAWSDDELAIAHAGDSRIYRLRPWRHEIECLTRDDVAGDTEPMNRMLVNAVGGLEDVRIHERSIECVAGDVFVCCTSRVWRSLGDAELLAIVERSREDAPAVIIARVAEREPRGGAAVAIVSYKVPGLERTGPPCASIVVDADALAAAPARWHGRRIDVTAQWHYAFEISRFVDAWLEVPEHAPVTYGTYRARVVGTWIYPERSGYGHMGFWPGVMHAETIDIVEVIARPPATRDGLTGLPKRDAIGTAFEQASRPCSLALLDIDWLKRINDTHGFRIGDEVIRSCASAIAGALRPDDVVARWGGEEYAVLMPGTTLEAATKLLDGVLARVRALAIASGDDRVVVTISAGVVEVGLVETVAAALERADRALYDAKRTGRDRLGLK